ncbi:ATP-grasp domain-containing protein [Catenuloplanes japonicus]|uniref:ATP-grasp domain-containing protein n=1 Tax=Catenuloplanes japonicus TaxID=33876 RepID=UPI001E40E1C2|nr:ATP-grasp domain-containing protein [Catenuloplanes japonicus]
MMLLIVPADPMRPRRADDHFAAEAAAARDAGVEVAVIDHDALAGGGDADAAVRRVPAGDDAVYRGWMLPADGYATMAAALERRGVTLRTGAAAYRSAHELPGWYEALRPVTPGSVWTAGDARADFDHARHRLGPGAAVLRDYTKSAKHHWHEAAYVPDLTDADAAWRVASRLRELRGDDFTGGFVLRRFEPLTAPEVRTWWIAGEHRLTGPHPDTPGPHDEPDLTSVTPLVAALHLPFVTVDLARREDGAWRVVELGDGQVSDRPAAVTPERLLAALLAG